MDADVLNKLFDKELLGNPWKIPPLLSGDDLLDELFGEDAEAVQENFQDYLQREERILTLAREKQKMGPRKRSGKEFFRLFQSDIRKNRNLPLSRAFNALAAVVEKKIVNPELEKIEALLNKHEISDGVTGNIKSALEAMVGPEGAELKLDLSPTKLEQAVMDSFARPRGKRKVGVGMENSFGRRYCLCLNCTLLAAHREGDKIWKEKNGKKVKTSEPTEVARAADSYGLAENALIRNLDQQFQRYIQDMSEEERMQDAVYRSIWEAAIRQIKMEEDSDGCLPIERQAATPEFLAFLEKYGYWYRVSDSSDQEGDAGRNAFPYWKLAFFAPLIPGLPRFWYAYDDDSNSAKEYRYQMRGVYAILFFLLYDIYCDEREQERLDVDQKQAAKVFQTKKNIPDKYLQVMRNSVFNETFGYVELDEECDLDSFREIEKDYLALNKLCFGEEWNYKDVAVRFRKLGRHHAYGMYFYKLLCLCVDIRHPSSFGHEKLHMIDDLSGGLSRHFDFMEIRERYSLLLNRTVDAMPEGDPLKKVLKGKSKYNLDYYLRPSEIFARCGEIYFTHIHKVKNSLMEPEYGMEYPVEDNILLEYINTYYSKLFPVSASLDI